MERQGYYVIKVYNRKNPDKVLNKYYYDTVREACAAFENRKIRGDVSRIILSTCQGQLIELWERK